MNKNTYTKRASLGKHGIERPSVKKRRKWSVGLVAVALAGLLAVGGTVAWLVNSTGTVTNTFVAGGVTTDIVEGFDGKAKSDVKITNTGNIPAYVRAQVIINWQDAQGNLYAGETAPDGSTYVETFVDFTKEDCNWVESASDGFYYYRKALDPEATTDVLVESIVVKYPDGVNPEDAPYQLSVEILTEAIQAIPDGAFNDLWSTSSGLTASNGMLSKTGTVSE